MVIGQKGWRTGNELCLSSLKKINQLFSLSRLRILEMDPLEVANPVLFISVVGPE